MSLIRLFFTTALLALLAKPAWSTTVEVLYGWCKPLADRGFNLATQDDVGGLFRDAMCKTYIGASIEHAQRVCLDLDWVEKDYSDRPDIVNGYAVAAALNGTSAELEDIDAAIQAFVNFAAANPNKWDHTPEVQLWLVKDFPCKE